MKKLFLAVAVSPIVAGSASAATIYEKDGFTYKLNGDFQIQLRQKHGDDKDPHVEFDDLELKNYISYDLGEGLAAFGRLDFGYKNAADNKTDSSNLEEAYVGLRYGVASFRFGKQEFASDEFGVEALYESLVGDDQFDNVATDGDDSLRLDIELESVYLSASYELEAEGEESENGEYFDLFASTQIAGLTLAAAYQNATPAVGDEDFDTYGVSASYDFGLATLAADYSISDDTDTRAEETLYNVVATFEVANTSEVAIGMQNFDRDDGSDDIRGWYANVTYKFPMARNVHLFAEIADTDEDNADVGYLAGMRLKF